MNPTCHIHPHVELRCPACAGSKAARRTPRRRAAARTNGRAGGRPQQLTDAEIERIRNCYAFGASDQAVAEVWGISRSYASLIRRGKRRQVTDANKD